MRRRTARGRIKLGALGVLAVAVLLIPAATGSHTPSPASVTIAGSLQSEAGCGGDWDAGCASTHLTYDADDTVYKFSHPSHGPMDH